MPAKGNDPSDATQREKQEARGAQGDQGDEDQRVEKRQLQGAFDGPGEADPERCSED